METISVTEAEKRMALDLQQQQQKKDSVATPGMKSSSNDQLNKDIVEENKTGTKRKHEDSTGLENDPNKKTTPSVALSVDADEYANLLKLKEELTSTKKRLLDAETRNKEWVEAAGSQNPGAIQSQLMAATDQKIQDYMPNIKKANEIITALIRDNVNSESRDVHSLKAVQSNLREYMKDSSKLRNEESFANLRTVVDSFVSIHNSYSTRMTEMDQKLKQTINEKSKIEKDVIDQQRLSAVENKLNGTINANNVDQYGGMRYGVTRQEIQTNASRGQRPEPLKDPFSGFGTGPYSATYYDAPIPRSVQPLFTGVNFTDVSRQWQCPGITGFTWSISDNNGEEDVTIGSSNSFSLTKKLI